MILPAAPVPPLLQASGLAVLRGERLVLSGLDLALERGGALLLTGPNGAGKSTLLRALAGLCPLDAGRLSWNGIDVVADPAAHAGRVAYLGHQDALKPGLSLRENLLLAATLGGGNVSASLDLFGLQALAGLPARLLSAGQRRRGALARVHLLGSPLWLLDEPSIGLDDAALDRLGTVLAAHRTAGGLVVATTHVGLPLPDAAVLRLGR